MRGFGEYARYVSWLLDSSAELIVIAPAPVIKRGYYVGGEATVPLPKGWEASVSLTGEKISRNDSLVWYDRGRVVALRQEERRIPLNLRTGKAVLAGETGIESAHRRQHDPNQLWSHRNSYLRRAR